MLCKSVTDLAYCLHAQWTTIRHHQLAKQNRSDAITLPRRHHLAQIFKTYKMFKTDLHDARCPPFLKFPTTPISKTWKFAAIILLCSKMTRDYVLDFQKYPGVSKDNSYWFWGSGTRPEILKSWEWRVSGLSHSQIEKLWVQNEGEWYYGASGHLFFVCTIEMVTKS